MRDSSTPESTNTAKSKETSAEIRWVKCIPAVLVPLIHCPVRRQAWTDEQEEMQEEAARGCLVVLVWLGISPPSSPEVCYHFLWPEQSKTGLWCSQRDLQESQIMHPHATHFVSLGCESRSHAQPLNCFPAMLVCLECDGQKPCKEPQKETCTERQTEDCLSHLTVAHSCASLWGGLSWRQSNLCRYDCGPISNVIVQSVKKERKEAGSLSYHSIIGRRDLGRKGGRVSRAGGSQLNCWYRSWNLHIVDLNVSCLLCSQCTPPTTEASCCPCSWSLWLSRGRSC